MTDQLKNQLTEADIKRLEWYGDARIIKLFLDAGRSIIAQNGLKNHWTARNLVEKSDGISVYTRRIFRQLYGLLLALSNI